MSGAIKLNASWTLGTGGRQDIDKQMVVTSGKLVDSRVSNIEFVPCLHLAQAHHKNYASFVPVSPFRSFEARDNYIGTPFP